MLSYQVEPDQPIRADLVITKHLPDLSRSYIKRLAQQGKLRFNGRLVNAGIKLKTAGQLQLDYDPQQLIDIPQLDLKIVYQDQQMLVIDKPAGVISHARGRFWQEPSVANSIRRYLDWQPSADDQRAGLVHRLDRATSGLMIIAKDIVSLARLQAQFKDRTVVKTYLAVVASQDIPPEGLIDKPIARNLSRPTTFKVDASGKSAQTNFKLSQSYPNYSWLELKPQTGRSHQLRVHLTSVGWSIVGDDIYGGQPAPRLLLHASQLKLRQPTSGKLLTIKADLPAEFAKFKS